VGFIGILTRMTFTGFCHDEEHSVGGQVTDIYPPAQPFCVEDRGELIGKRKCVALL
jgi:hypothetical protein